MDQALKRKYAWTINRSAVVVIHYGDPETTARCLAAFRVPGGSPDVILIDNDPDSRYDPARETGCIYLPQETNTGFAAGVNVGLKAAAGRGKKAVVILNNDVEAPLEAVLRLSYLAATRPCIFGAVELALDKHGTRTPEVIFAGGEVRWRETAVRLWKTPLHTQHPYCTGFVRGSCMGFSLDLVRRIGLFDETFWAYNEDVDFCLRALGANYQLCIDPGSRVWHRVSGSFDVRTRNYLMARNYIRLIKKYARGVRFLRAMGFSAAASLMSLARGDRRGKFAGFTAGVKAEYPLKRHNTHEPLGKKTGAS